MVLGDQGRLLSPTAEELMDPLTLKVEDARQLKHQAAIQTFAIGKQAEGPPAAAATPTTDADFAMQPRADSIHS